MASFHQPRLFRNFFLGGFECSSHRKSDGQRLDLLASTGHERFAAEDYQALSSHGIAAARDGIRWHLIERTPGCYDWSSVLPMVRAARSSGTQIVWDLCHYGWPDDLDIWSADFVERFARFATAAAELIRGETDGATVYCPINEISYWAWAGGEVGLFNPTCHQRGAELKRQLVRATIAAIDSIRTVDPGARLITAEPLINVEGGLGDEQHLQGAETYRLSQFEVLDMLSGRLDPELGGAPEFVDIVGVNYYPENQWYHGGPTIPMGHHAYRPLHDMLLEVHQRYDRPILIAETGAEGCGRPSWLHYVCGEVDTAWAAGVPIEGLCLYPILDYPGWANGRVCHVGLMSSADKDGRRSVCMPLARELGRQQAQLQEIGTIPERQANALAAAG